MTMPRTVGVETLDRLEQADPRAVQSRHDLRRIHRAMGTRTILRRALKDMVRHRREASPLRVLELGAGDGSLMLGVAQAIAAQFPKVELTLLDAQDLVNRSTITRFSGAGWAAQAKVADALDWAQNDIDTFKKPGSTAHWDLVVVNLFLHHFEGARLAALLGAISERSNRFFACEPRRAWLPLVASHLVGAIGANEVTREDAVLSVKAGFNEREITALWPQQGAQWHLKEYPAGLFSHCFRAERVGVK
jgi:hypothetical protein